MKKGKEICIPVFSQDRMERQCIDSMLGDMDSLLLFSVHIFSIGNHHSSVQNFNQLN